MFNLLVIFLAGAMVPIQTALNTNLSRTLKSPVLASFFVFVISAIALLLVLSVIRAPWPTRELVAQMPVWVRLSGVMGAGYTLILVWYTPRIGVGVATSAVVLGQVSMGLLLDHFSLFGLPQQSLSLGRVIAVFLISLGVMLLKIF